MARRRKSAERSEEGPAWLITFSDLMTLLLTFFVLLLSMAVIDERAKLVVLGSVTRVFGVGERVFNPKATRDKTSMREPGAMENMPPEDLAPMRDMIFDDVDKDLDFRENKYVQIFSINDEVLFQPGSTALSERGAALLDRILPYLQRIEYPLLISGHTGPRRDEEGLAYSVDLRGKKPDSTWLLSFRRADAVFRHLHGRGIPVNRLSLEAFGQFHPRFSNNTPEGRRKNRRVDLVLDKRNMEWIRKVEDLREKKPDVVQEHYYKGFRFNLSMPGSTPGGTPGGQGAEQDDTRSAPPPDSQSNDLPQPLPFSAPEEPSGFAPQGRP